MLPDLTPPLAQGRLPRSIWLPTLTTDYSPDGLDPDDIDALIAECGLDLTVVDELVEQTYRDANPAPRPVVATWTSEDRRRRRRTVRRITRSVDGTPTPAHAEPAPTALSADHRELEDVQTPVPSDPATWSGYDPTAGSAPSGEAA